MRLPDCVLLCSSSKTRHLTLAFSDERRCKDFSFVKLWSTFTWRCHRYPLARTVPQHLPESVICWYVQAWRRLKLYAWWRWRVWAPLLARRTMVSKDTVVVAGSSQCLCLLIAPRDALQCQPVLHGPHLRR